MHTSLAKNRMPNAQPSSPAQLKTGTAYLTFGAVMLASGIYAGAMSTGSSWLVFALLATSVLLFAMAISPLAREYMHGNSKGASSLSQTHNGTGGAGNAETVPRADAMTPPEDEGQIGQQAVSQEKSQVAQKIEISNGAKQVHQSDTQPELHSLAKEAEAGSGAANESVISPMVEDVSGHADPKTIEPKAKTLDRPQGDVRCKKRNRRCAQDCTTTCHPIRNSARHQGRCFHIDEHDAWRDSSDLAAEGPRKCWTHYCASGHRGGVAFSPTIAMKLKSPPNGHGRIFAPHRHQHRRPN